MSILRSLSNRVPVGTFLGQRLKPSLRFGGLMLQEAKSLSGYGIHHRCIHQFTKSILCQNERETPNGNSKQDWPREQDHTFLIIWRNDHDKILLGLFIEHIQNGGTNILYCGKDSWCGIVDKFNESTCLKCDSKYLQERLNSYSREYEIINHIRHHEKFSWDHQRQIVITTEDDWNEYIKSYPEAKFYKNIMQYFDLLEKVFGHKQEQKTV